MSDSDKSRIVVGVCGGVAAFKTAAMVSKLVQQGHEVQVIMTAASRQFAGDATFAALTGRPVAESSFDTRFPLGAHIELARDSDLLVVAPATANFIGKIANGIADDLLTTLYLCFTGPVLIAPAMNCEMWDKPSLQRNLKRCVDDGVALVDPQEGWLSCRTRGVGRMAEPETIQESVNEILSSRS